MHCVKYYSFHGNQLMTCLQESCLQEGWLLESYLLESCLQESCLQESCPQFTSLICFIRWFDAVGAGDTYRTLHLQDKPSYLMTGGGKHGHGFCWSTLQTNKCNSNDDQSNAKKVFFNSMDLDHSPVFTLGFHCGYDQTWTKFFLSIWLSTPKIFIIVQYIKVFFMSSTLVYIWSYYWKTYGEKMSCFSENDSKISESFFQFSSCSHPRAYNAMDQMKNVLQSHLMHLECWSIM